MNFAALHVESLAVRLAEERADAELELVGAILAAPAVGVSAAERVGVTPHLFSQDDLQALYIVTAHARHRERLAVLRLARAMLRDLGMWDDYDTRDFTRGMSWGHESLVALACSYPGPSLVPLRARQLIELCARQEAATAHYQRLVGLLDGTIGVEADGAPAQLRFQRHQIGFHPVLRKGA
jgi:hypothetical protein